MNHNKAGTSEKEKAKLVAMDRETLTKVVRFMHNYTHEVNARNNKGNDEMEAIHQIAPKAIKVLANYL